MNINRCTWCRGRFGMVRYPWWGERFCSQKCRKAFLDKMAQDRDRIRKWIASLKAGVVT
jgi:hypothetical protein